LANLPRADDPFMPRFLLHHAHEAAECGTAFAAWRGFTSPLRRRPTVATCEHGGHELWWLVEAPGADAALAQLPRWIAARTRPIRVTFVPIP
jgi:hypothetical protein